MTTDEIGLPVGGEPVVLCRGREAQRRLTRIKLTNSRLMGGRFIPEFRGTVMLKEMADAEGKCIWCEMLLVEGETDPDRRHVPLCYSYTGRKSHIHDESCRTNPLCPVFFRPPAPPSPEAPRPEKPKKQRRYRPPRRRRGGR